MHNANLLLIALAFVLGLALTFALMIGRVEREVPVSAPATAAEPAPADSEPPTDTPAASSDAADSEKDSP
jgi:hypothetical protein